MTVTLKKEGTELISAVEGRLDTLTSPQLEEKLSDELSGITKLVFDLKDLVYISSAGLRVLVAFSKKMAGHGEMVIRNANNDIMDIFEVTGFTEAFKIEK